jgi:hypothetical protein
VGDAAGERTQELVAKKKHQETSSMNPILKRIKRCIMERRYRFTEKAGMELLCDELSEQEVLESILNANEIDKTIRSRALEKGSKREYLYIIKSISFDGVLIYTKGKLQGEGAEEEFYVLISAKLDEGLS